MRRLLFAVLAVLIVATVGATVAVLREWSGPAYDTGLAERSFLAALRREHPHRTLSVSCTGQRDGSHYFACQIEGHRGGIVPDGAGVSYDGEADEYRADAGGGSDGTKPIVFPPVK